MSSIGWESKFGINYNVLVGKILMSDLGLTSRRWANSRRERKPVAGCMALYDTSLSIMRHIGPWWSFTEGWYHSTQACASSWRRVFMKTKGWSRESTSIFMNNFPSWATGAVKPSTVISPQPITSPHTSSSRIRISGNAHAIQCLKSSAARWLKFRDGGSRANANW